MNIGSEATLSNIRLDVIHQHCGATVLLQFALSALHISPSPIYVRPYIHGASLWSRIDSRVSDGILSIVIDLLKNV